MNGREELDFEIETKIINRLKDQPDIIKRYYYWLPTSKAVTTKRNYINSIIRYKDYLKSIGNNIDDYEFLASQKKADINAYADSILAVHERYGKPKKNGCGSVRLNLYALKSFFEFLCDEEIITKNPFLKYEMPKDNKETPIIALNTKEINEVKRILTRKYNKFAPRDNAMFTLGIRTGLRISALRAINIDDIDFEEKTIKVVEKGNIERYVYFGEDTKEVLKKYIQWRNDRLIKANAKTDALFINSLNGRISYNGFAKILREATDGLDKHVTPHKMRSTCATNVYKKTGDIYLTADVLGHKNLSNTRKYAKIDVENKQKAANILDKL